MINYYYMFAWVKGIKDHDYYEVYCKDGVQKQDIENAKKDFHILLQAMGYKIEDNKIYAL